MKPIQKRKYTVDEVRDIIELEGLDYAIMHYMGSDRIEDPKLAEMWDAADKLLHKLEDYIYVNSSKDE